MNHLPKITVITPTLNAAAHIESNVQNVAEQSYQNIEHIIVDGISSDDTIQIVNTKLALFHHLRIIQEGDAGLYDAMNKGIRASKGDYLFFLGSDDRFHDKEVLKDLVINGLLKDNKVVYGNVKIVGDTGWAKDGDIYAGLFSRKKLMKHNICHQSIFYPREVFLKLGLYDTNYKINADWDLNWRCWAKDEFAYANRIISVFHAGGHSTGATDEAFKLDYLKKLKQYFNLTPEELHELGRTSPWGNLVMDDGISKHGRDSIVTNLKLLIRKLFPDKSL